MTTDDNRPQAAGGYSDSGLFDGGDDRYATRDYGSGQGLGSRGDSSFDDGYSSGATTVLPGTSTTSSSYDSEFGGDFDDEEPRSPGIAWHGGLDFGLLVLRLVLGGLFIAHGLDKFFGWFDGLGMGGTEELLRGFGYTEPTILAWVVALSETAGGVLLVLGLFFPAGAAAILGVMANVIVVKGDWNTFLGGVEMEMMYAGAAFALLFTGPGRVAIDRHTHWFRKAPIYGAVFLVLAAGASVVTLVVFR
ncbi:DoxX family protein [Actinophytocola sp.]|uniref:DoxX family protein n=1 Tax=Actinophytocola sp. TaxID=1872138 RepID=UPI0025BFB819|nr:DoxX family protein [Actinophytocola sp.]